MQFQGRVLKRGGRLFRKFPMPSTCYTLHTLVRGGQRGLNIYMFRLHLPLLRACTRSINCISFARLMHGTKMADTVNERERHPRVFHYTRKRD